MVALTNDPLAVNFTRPLNSRGTTKPHRIVEAAFSLSLETPYKYLTNVYQGTNYEERRQLGDLRLSSHSDRELEQAEDFIRKLGGQVRVSHLINLAAGKNPHEVGAAETLQEMLSLGSSISGYALVRLTKWLKDCVNREMISLFRETQMIYPELVRVVDGTYKPTKRYRVYDVGSMGEVPKGGQIENHMSLEAKDAYETVLRRYAMMFSVDECVIDDGDLGEFRDMIRALANTALRAPEEILFKHILEHLDQADAGIQFTQDWFDAMWECWCKTGSIDPNDPMNPENGCSRQRYVKGSPLLIVMNPCHLLKATRMLVGTPLVCGSVNPTTNPDGCSVLYASNLYGDKIKILFSYSVPEQRVVMLPATGSGVEAFVMTVRNGVRVPIVQSFDTVPNKLGMVARAVFRFGIDQADRHMIKTSHEVNQYLAQQASAENIQAPTE